MNPITKLEIAFEPVSELSAWTKPIRLRDGAARGERFSRRFHNRRLNSAGSVSFAKFLLRNGGNAAPRGELVVRHRLSQRRLCLPNHTLERPTP